ncbi:hypothetical protein, partial [Pelagicoccus sp. SDUM812002]|uniref:hypothetical protein n=1 Tax=Pelagicoccus sp. SDUM812002 TaxID=3041266 RepID=UPI00280CC65A|nr:hypothetical protein [Pelagicoccus sp. SDUM812002]
NHPRLFASIRGYEPLNLIKTCPVADRILPASLGEWIQWQSHDVKNQPVRECLNSDPTIRD